MEKLRQKDQKIYFNTWSATFKNNADRVSLSREMGGRGLISCGGCIRIEANNLGWYIRNSVEPLIKGVQTAETIEYNNTVNKKEFKQLDNGKEGTMEKQNNVWVVCKRNARNNG